LGYCGSNLTNPSSELAIVRHVGLYGFPSSTSTGCGNYMLNPGEDCDDGNKVSGDGCSSACLIERTGYWDCDILGEPCLPQCGWPLSVLMEGLLQFPVPPPYSQPWCARITYTDFLQVLACALQVLSDPQHDIVAPAPQPGHNLLLSQSHKSISNGMHQLKEVVPPVHRMHCLPPRVQAGHDGFMQTPKEPRHLVVEKTSLST